MKGIRPTWVEVDLDAIKNNIKAIREKAKDKELIAVVKADAYGHGAEHVAPVLLENGADRLAVAVITEAIELRKNGIKAPILILGYTPLDFGEELIDYDIEQTVYSLDYANKLSDIALQKGKIAKIHIALDTGMERIGFSTLDVESLNDIEKISKLKGIQIIGTFTHFSTADEEDKAYTISQVEAYKKMVDELEKKNINLGIKHVANSATILDLEEYYFDGVRPGIILYGYYPSNEVKKEIKIEPALTLKSKIVHLKEVKKGTYIGYGRSYVTDSTEKIATLPIGYADGYERALKDKGKVIINNQFAPIVGNVCMDQCMVDVTNIPNVKMDDEVILLGKNSEKKFDADDIAKEIDTISYEVLCKIGRRVPRVYKSNGQVIDVKNYL